MKYGLTKKFKKNHLWYIVSMNRNGDWVLKESSHEHGLDKSGWVHKGRFADLRSVAAYFDMLDEFDEFLKKKDGINCDN